MSDLVGNQNVGFLTTRLISQYLVHLRHCSPRTLFKVNHKDFAERLLAWMHYGFPELGDDGGNGIGMTTYDTLNHPQFLKDPYKVIFWAL